MLRFLGARKHRLVLSGSGGRGRTGLPGVGDESSMSLLFHLSSWGLGASRLKGGGLELAPPLSFSGWKFSTF